MATYNSSLGMWQSADGRLWSSKIEAVAAETGGRSATFTTPTVSSAFTRAPTTSSALPTSGSSFLQFSPTAAPAAPKPAASSNSNAGYSGDSSALSGDFLGGGGTLDTSTAGVAPGQAATPETAAARKAAQDARWGVTKNLEQRNLAPATPVMTKELSDQIMESGNIGGAAGAYNMTSDAGRKQFDIMHENNDISPYTIGNILGGFGKSAILAVNAPAILADAAFGGGGGGGGNSGGGGGGSSGSGSIAQDHAVPAPNPNDSGMLAPADVLAQGKENKLDTTWADKSRQMSEDVYNKLLEEANKPEGPSAAETQLLKGQERAERNAIGNALSQGGTWRGQASALARASGDVATQQMEGAADVAALRAKEEQDHRANTLQALQNAGVVATSIRSGDIEISSTDAQLMGKAISDAAGLSGSEFGTQMQYILGMANVDEKYAELKRLKANDPKGWEKWLKAGGEVASVALPFLAMI